MRRLRSRSLARKIFLLAVLIVAVFILFIAVLEHNLRPSIMAIAETKARMIALDSINNAIHKKVVDGGNFRDLIDVRTDDQGRIVLMQANTIKINQLTTETLLELNRNLRELKYEGFAIPLGQVLGSQLLANYGPGIKVKITPVGAARVNIKDDFEEAGINQARHKLYMNVNTDLKIVVPLMSSKIEVQAQVPLAETFIIGDVPGTYVKMDSGNLKALDAILNKSGN